jgi:hypothetical protein
LLGASQLYGEKNATLTMANADMVCCLMYHGDTVPKDVNAVTAIIKTKYIFSHIWKIDPNDKRIQKINMTKHTCICRTCL